MSHHCADGQKSVRDGKLSELAGAVAIVATLDTKGHEASYLADIIEGCGRKVVLIDVGTASWEAGGTKQPDRNGARVASPAEFLKEIAATTRTRVRDLLATGTIGAIVGVAGGKGSAVFGEIVSDLPYGFPKLLVSSARPALLAELAVHNDIILYPTLVDLFGINAFTERVLVNAGRAVAAMRYAPTKHGRKRKIVAITAFGVTTPAASQCVARLAEAGVDAIVFPANGAGGRKMEELIAAGEFDAVIDLTTTELADEIVGGTASAGPDRLKAASRQLIPQVIAPGAVDMVNFGPPSSVPDQFRGRQLYSHTPYTTLMRTTSSENASIGRLTAERLTQAKGPAIVLWPGKGVSDYDREGSIFRNPDADSAWLEAVKSSLAPSITVRELNCHINDPEFAETATTWILKQLGQGG
ncbi:Tm-1-like ATP-binding domain-containing protein [Bradyrhizobium sp. CCGUVB1N3]|uniref:Tm-1-like ATP-binding domain-containing protein n=1 Tax=Bradyrhizobium sp. CCGUVB1N3 TaxID=2949629 RepID=UPI0020B41387|nr:Tm-1-like ATP-binding domain-containing protein [Bradyrhizobium sp. CCGUVB1N3]MCP3476087.1 Tm-1-like ATP-binding domain-containing protein [Bradyrhizobium sp. CCGUVB1N3]